MTKTRASNRTSSVLIQAEVAQSVEQWTENPRVGSSILSLGTPLANFLGIGLVAVRLTLF